LLFLLSRYNLFLLIHGSFFLLLFIYLDFDFFQERGDWDDYHRLALSVSNYLKGLNVSISSGLSNEKAYIYLIGYIYYLFNDSIILAVFINVFFTVVSAIMLFIFLNKLFDYRVAKIALYLAAFCPLFFVYEISLWKECFVFFLMTSGSYMTFMAVRENKLLHIFLTIMIYSALFNVRFFLIVPFLVYILFYYCFIEKKLTKAISIIVIIGLSLILLLDQSSGIEEKGTFQHYIISSGISMIDKQSNLFNYQITNLNPKMIANVFLQHSDYFIKRIIGFYTNVFTLNRVYYVPFLSNNFITGQWWIFSVLSYITSLFAWIFMFFSLFAFKDLLTKIKKDTALIWLPIIIIPLIVSVFGNNQRYLIVLIFNTISCIAFGLVHSKLNKNYLIFSGIVVFFLILLINRDSFIFYPIIFTLFVSLIFKRFYFWGKRLSLE